MKILATQTKTPEKNKRKAANKARLEVDNKFSSRKMETEMGQSQEKRQIKTPTEMG